MKIHLYELLKKEIKRPLRFFIGVIILTGISGVLLVTVINSVAENIANKDTTQTYFLLYILFVGLFLTAKRYIFDTCIDIIENVVGRIRKRLGNKIRHTELSTFEKIGTSPFYARLTQDVLSISDIAWYLISSVQGTVIIFFMLVYIATLSSWAFAMVFLGIIVCIVNYALNNAAISENFAKITIKETRFFEKFNHIIQGFKEIKINRKKSNAVFKKYTKVTDDRTVLRIKMKQLYNHSLISSQAFFYIMVAVILFIIPHYHTEHADTIIKITAAILFIVGPIEGIFDAIPTLSIAENAALNILELEKQLDAELAATFKKFKPSKKVLPPISFENNIQLQGMVYEYENNDPAHAFSIGPMNLTFNKGEVIFITGGNGSGKSTFLKMFLGLYTPKYGNLYIDRDITKGEEGVLITQDNYQQYSELFTIIFTDFHLFDKLYGLDDIDPGEVNQLLLSMGLSEEKTMYRNGGFTNVKLSSGQKKRLALVTCILEDKDIYIFDEVAADLDPEFRDTYYFEILSELKARNKTVFVVSHDKSYWHVADRLLIFNKGQVTEQKNASKANISNGSTMLSNG